MKQQTHWAVHYEHPVSPLYTAALLCMSNAYTHITDTIQLEVNKAHSKAAHTPHTNTPLTLCILHTSISPQLLKRLRKLCIVDVAIVVFVIIAEDLIDNADEVLLLHWWTALTFLLNTSKK